MRLRSGGGPTLFFSFFFPFFFGTVYFKEMVEQHGRRFTTNKPNALLNVSA